MQRLQRMWNLDCASVIQVGQSRLHEQYRFMNEKIKRRDGGVGGEIIGGRVGGEVADGGAGIMNTRRDGSRNVDRSERKAAAGFSMGETEVHFFQRIDME
ncbi:hypothetical protein LINPERHAP2_LOCUS14777, partial [Linum perenne]